MRGGGLEGIMTEIGYEDYEFREMHMKWDGDGICKDFLKDKNLK
jgi:predicted hydrocarbon binding protein